MPANAQLHFADASEPIADVRVHRLEYLDALNQPFLLTLGLTSSDPSIDPAQVLGKRAMIDLEGEPWLSRLGGIVVAFRQRTAVTGLTNGESAYEAIVRPPLWLLARRFGRRVHQNATALEVITATLAALGGVAPAPVSRVSRSLPVREYTAQYDETDLAFVRRIPAENHRLHDETRGRLQVLRRQEVDPAWRGQRHYGWPAPQEQGHLVVPGVSSPPWAQVCALWIHA